MHQLQEYLINIRIVPLKMLSVLGNHKEAPNTFTRQTKKKLVSRNVKGVHGITKPPMWKDLLDNQENKKGKEVVVRQQPKRIVKEMPFVCRSPHLKDHVDFRDRLEPEKKCW